MATNKYEITIPAPVKLVQFDGRPVRVFVPDGKGGMRESDEEVPPASFRTLVGELTCTPHFAAEVVVPAPMFTPEVLLSGMACIEMASGEVGTTQVLDAADFERLRRAVMNHSWHPQIGKCHMPHIQAILGARLVTEPRSSDLRIPGRTG